MAGYPFADEPGSAESTATAPPDTGHGTMPLEVHDMGELAGLLVRSQHTGSSDHTAPALQRSVNARGYAVDNIRLGN